MVALPWVFTILAVDVYGGLHEYDVSRFQTHKECIEFLKDNDIKLSHQTINGFSVVKKSCRKVTYEPKSF